jgi:HEAT repeat protein
MRGPAATALFAALLSLAILAPRASADERSDYLIRLLQTSAAFRVRTQAAISLGSGLPDPAVTAALAAALRDENAAVRAAAANSLGRVGDASVLTALRTAERDPEAAVRTAATAAIAAIQARPAGGGGGSSTTSGSGSGGGATPPPSGPARYYVGMGRPNVTGTLSPAVVGSVRGMVERRLGTIGGIAIAPDGESVAAAQRALRSRSLAGFYLDISVTVESLPTGAIRARVSIVVQDYPARNVRSMLSGSATATGASSADASLIEAAVGSALNRLPTALAASGH